MTLGLVYYGYRFYCPNIAKWLTRDPIGETGGVNLYAFVLNNPVSWVDPWGLEVLDEGMVECMIKEWKKITKKEKDAIIEGFIYGVMFAGAYSSKFGPSFGVVGGGFMTGYFVLINLWKIELAEYIVNQINNNPPCVEDKCK